LRPTTRLIVVANRQLRDLTDDCLSALYEGNTPPEVFTHSGRLVRVIGDQESRHIIEELNKNSLRCCMAAVADYVKPNPGKDSAGKVTNVPPPYDAVHNILGFPPDEWQFPPLRGVIESPVLRPDGSIIETPGYDPVTCLCYCPSEDITLIEPENPTAREIEQAREAIFDVLSDFPFADGEQSRANVIGGMLTPVCRAAITGPTPILLVDATDAGSGKSLIAELISIIATGRPADMMPAPKDEAEWGKMLTSVLCQGSAVVVIDNLNHRLDSAELCRALTSESFSDRVLGKNNQTISLPVRCSWIATGNNIQLGGDMPRRCYRVRLDPQCSRPAERTHFKYPQLKKWAAAHRSELLSALFTLARAWFIAGKPVATVRTVGSFENWAEIIGGILQYAGITGFLENTNRLYSQADAESAQWEGFF
jgi:hypothetical protein